MRTFIMLATAMVLFTSSAYAASKTELDTKVKATLEKCRAEVKGCTQLTDTAAGIVVFPTVTKGGLAVAIESGKGALIENGKTTGYYKTSSASFGATLGVGSKSMVIVLKTLEELSKFKKSAGWEAGADAGVAMLDTGASGSIDTSNIKEPVVGIIFGETGILADVSIKGSKISAIDPSELG